jgi:hydroxyacylglutathione hydrolase
MTAQVHQFPCLTDNFGVLVHDPATGATAAIDVPEAAPVLKALAEKGWTLTDILVTHRHGDHVQGIPEVKRHFPKARVIAPAGEADRVPMVDATVKEGDVASVGSLRARVMETPGHTIGHIVYWFEADKLLFAGDTLFSIGCGRVNEAPMGVMWNSLLKLAALPEDTAIYCGHEYTLANARFALTIEPGNAQLIAHMKEIEALRARGEWTLPTTLGLELAINPFLRAEDPAVQAQLGMVGAAPADVFAEIRERKNRF